MYIYIYTYIYTYNVWTLVKYMKQTTPAGFPSLVFFSWIDFPVTGPTRLGTARLHVVCV